MNETLAAAVLQELRAFYLTGICRQLIQINSVNPPGNEAAVAAHVAEVLGPAGIDIELVPHTEGRASLLARLKGSGELPGLLYSAHLDTVAPGEEPWTRDPFGGDLAGGKVWGRGAADMKGGLAAMMAAAKALARATNRLGVTLRGDLVLAFTAGEEVNSMGAAALARRGDLGPVQAVVVAEPSSNDLYIAEKGALWVELTTVGRTAHGSMPDLGRNAVMMMVALLAEIDRLSVEFTAHPLLGGFTRSINTVAGGLKTNVVPDRCTATIDMRTVPGQDHAAILQGIQGVIDDLTRRMPGFQARLSVTNDHPALYSDPDDPVVVRFSSVIERVTGKRPEPQGVRYYTDAVEYAPVLNAPLIICGPGPAAMAHQPDEYVEAAKLDESARILALAAVELLA